jgi:hypothetical protein
MTSDYSLKKMAVKICMCIHDIIGTKDWKDKECKSLGAIPLKYLNRRANVDYGYLYLKEMNISLVRSYGTAGSMVSCIHMQIFTAIFFKE